MSYTNHAGGGRRNYAEKRKGRTFMAHRASWSKFSAFLSDPGDRSSQKNSPSKYKVLQS